MNRRDTVLALLALGATSFTTEAQQGGKVYRIACLFPGSARTPGTVEYERSVGAFRQGLRELGYIEGRNIVIELKYVEGRRDRFPALAKELVDLKPDLIVTASTPVTRAVSNATSTIPIVMATVLDPVAAGFVKSLARPGGNITGSSELSEELSAKRLELLKEMIPKASRVAVLFDPTHPTNALDLKRTELAAEPLGLTLMPVQGRDMYEIEKNLSKVVRSSADALLVLLSDTTYVHRSRILHLSARNRMPTIYGWREGAEGGALMSYGVRLSGQYRRAAVYVDKILKGAKPADLPVEQPTEFEMVINLKTAKALSLTIPKELLLRADRVIE